MGHRLSHSDVAIDPRALQHDPDLGTKGPRALARVEAEHGHVAGGPLPVALEDLDGGRLAGTVRPQQPEHLAAAHLEVDAPYRLEITIGLPQTADLDRWVGHRPDDASVGPAGGRPSACPPKGGRYAWPEPASAWGSPSRRTTRGSGRRCSIGWKASSVAHGSSVCTTSPAAATTTGSSSVPAASSSASSASVCDSCCVGPAVSLAQASATASTRHSSGIIPPRSPAGPPVPSNRSPAYMAASITSYTSSVRTRPPQLRVCRNCAASASTRRRRRGSRRTSASAAAYSPVAAGRSSRETERLRATAGSATVGVRTTGARTANAPIPSGSISTAVAVPSATSMRIPGSMLDSSSRTSGPGRYPW